MGPSLLAPAGGWRAVHDGALWAPTAMLYTMGPFGPPSRTVLRAAAPIMRGAAIPWAAPLGAQKKNIGSQLKKSKKKNK